MKSKQKKYSVKVCETTREIKEYTIAAANLKEACKEAEEQHGRQYYISGEGTGYGFEVIEVTEN